LVLAKGAPLGDQESINMPRRLTTRLYDNAYLLLSIMALCWAGNQVLGRAVAGHIPPIAYSFLRWSLATVIVFPFAIPHVRHDWRVICAHWRYLAFVGAIGGGLFNTLQYIGLNHTTALNSVVLNSTGPIFIAMASFVIFRERLTARQLAGAAVSMTGVLGILTKGNLDTLHELTFNSGDLLLLIGMATNGIYTALLRDRPAIHWLSFLFTLFLISALVVLPFLMWEIALGGRMEVTSFTLAAVAYIAIFPSVVAYICLTRGVELIGPNRSGIFLHMIPLFGALLAVGLLGEPLRVYHVVGFALIICGVALASRKRR
jgi:drug/metabolite transporter (DMT)-like permease